MGLKVNKFLYAAMFLIALPLLLILWAAGTKTFVTLPVYDNPVAGIIVAVTGMIIMLSGMLALIRIGSYRIRFTPAPACWQSVFRFIRNPQAGCG
jgi:hypothetical protein